MTVFDPSFPIEASVAVSVRELSRSPARLVDRVERDGEVIALCRFGRIVAILAPVPERMVVTFENEALPEKQARAAEAPDVRIPEWIEQSEAAQAVLLRALGNHPMPYHINGLPQPIGDLMVAKSKLELSDFADQTWRGNFLTPAGLAAARTLRRRLDKGNPPPAS